MSSNFDWLVNELAGQIAARDQPLRKALPVSGREISPPQDLAGLLRRMQQQTESLRSSLNLGATGATMLKATVDDRRAAARAGVEQLAAKVLASAKGGRITAIEASKLDRGLHELRAALR